MSSAEYDLTRCLSFLAPGAQFGTTDNDWARTEWLDPRPMPTDAQCAAAWLLVQAQDAAEAQAAQTATANESAIGQQLDAALAANLSDVAANNAGIADNDAWLAANAGNNLTTTVLTARLKKTVQQNTAAAKQRNAIFKELNGLIRLIRKKLETADTLKAPPTE